MKSRRALNRPSGDKVTSLKSSLLNSDLQELLRRQQTALDPGALLRIAVCSWFSSGYTSCSLCQNPSLTRSSNTVDEEYV